VGKGYVRRRIASAPSRILVHLLCATQAGESDLHRLTQEGIAHDIRSGRSTVAKATLRLDALDLVVAQREHVPGHRLRKYVYRLTEAGWDEAVRERIRLGRRIVRVAGLEIKDLRVRASDLPELFPAAGDFSRILARVRRGVLSLEDTSAKDPDLCLPIAWGADRPQPGDLVGRVEEGRKLDAWLASREPAIAITGMAGIGKTALAAAAVARWRSRHAIFWAAVRPWSSPAALTADLAKFLAAAGRRQLEAALVDRARLDEEALGAFLKNELRGLRAVLVFDDVHMARPAVRRWLELLATSIQSTPTRVVFLGRAAVRVPAPGPRTHRRPEMVLGPLSGRAASELLRRHGWDSDDPIAAGIARRARGNPLLLVLGAASGVAAGSEIAKYLEDEVWLDLNPPERRTLEALCCLRRGAPERVLLAMAGAQVDALRRLERRHLLDGTASGNRTVHPSISDFVRRRTPRVRAQVYHARATRAFLSALEPSSKLEAIHHALESGMPETAAEVLRQEGEGLLNSVSFASLRDILEPLNLASVPPTARLVLAEAQGDVLRREGSMRPARARYEQGLRLADPVRHPGDRARILRKLAELDRLEGRHAQARDRLVEAAPLAESARDHREASNVYREFALVAMVHGDLADAEGALKRALKAARAARDPGRFSRALLVFGTLEAARGRPEEGLQRKLLALRHAEGSGELLEVARDSISLGVSYAEMKRFDEALRYHERGLGIARVVGDARLVALSQANRAATLIDLERWSDARLALEEADRLQALLGAKASRGFIAMARAELEIGLGHWRRASDSLESGLDILRSYAGPYDLTKALVEAGKLYERHGEQALANERWLEALRLARGLRNPAMVSEIERKLSLPEKALVVP